MGLEITCSDVPLHPQRVGQWWGGSVTGWWHNVVGVGQCVAGLSTVRSRDKGGYVLCVASVTSV